MKIPTINNSLYSNREKSQLTSNRVSFLRKTKNAKIVSDKISTILPSMKLGDVVTVGKDIASVKEGLQKAILQFNCTIKRIFHIVASVAVPMAITIDDEDDFKCINIGDATFALVTSENNPDTPCKHLALEPTESSYLSEGDTIVIGDYEIVVSDVLNDFANAQDFEFTLPSPSKLASKVYDFSIVQQPEIEKNNLSVLKELISTSETTKKRGGLSFKDVGGLDKVLDELKKSVVYPIKYPFAYEDVRLNKGILLYGPPGTGKTLLAEALAGECAAHYTKICGSELESKWVGETEENWRNLFNEAKEKQPSIIFIDEFDAVAKNRDNSTTDAHGPKVVNQILALMSDLEKSSDKVFVIAATNKPKLFDSAVVRSGRFGKHIEVTAPDRSGLDAIFEIHTKGKSLDKNLDKKSLLDLFYEKRTTGADIKHIVNEAHLNSWVRCGIFEKMEQETLLRDDIKKVFINQEDFSKAFEQWSKQQNKNDRKPIGYGK